MTAETTPTLPVYLAGAAITRARSRGLDVEVISAGHASSVADRMSGALLVRTVSSGPVEVDPQTRRARIPAGTRWGAVAEAAAQYSLGAAHASSPDVGAVSDAAPLLDAWTGWTKTAPREVTTSFRILRLPPLPGVPEPLTHGPVVCLDGAAVATTSAEVPDVSAKVDDLLGRVHGVARPLLATWRPAATLDVPRTHMDPPIQFPPSATTRYSATSTSTASGLFCPARTWLRSHPWCRANYGSWAARSPTRLLTVVPSIGRRVRIATTRSESRPMRCRQRPYVGT
jgi:hypothetical protein